MGPLQCTVLLLIFVGSSTTFFTTTPQCGHAFYTRTGIFSSPSYRAPNGISNGSEFCEWRITGDSDEKIVLNITDIDIIKTPFCTQGFVEVRDGYWYSSPLLGRVCGRGRLDPIYATGNKMYISYKYNNPNGHKGFIANFESRCGGDLFVENSTQFSTPSYPDQYPLNKKCIWRIVVPDYQKAEITFHSFDVETQNDCLYDYVEIRQGLTEDSTLIGRYCNAFVPDHIVSNTSYLYVTFVSDMSIQRGGFVATIGSEQEDSDDCSTELNNCAQICINTPGSFKCACESGYVLGPNGRDCLLACGGVLNATSGTIETPLYPEKYPANTTCTWDITAEPDYFITLFFTEFDLEESSTNNGTERCIKDRLEIYNKDDVNDTLSLQGTYCGEEIPKSITAQSSTLRLVFHSDSSVQKNGFSVNYTTKIGYCSINGGNCLHDCRESNEIGICQCATGWTLAPNKRDCSNGYNYEISSLNGTIQSPNYPSNYPNNAVATWQFRTLPGQRFNLRFIFFTLENAPCTRDSVVVRDGITGTAKSLGQWCGTSVQTSVTTSANEMYLQFRSDGSVVAKGFQASYNPICGGELQATDQKALVYSHADYGFANYGNGTSCKWVITAIGNGAVVELSFKNFWLVNNCESDYVEILDGKDNNVISLGKFCGTQKPPKIVSVINALTVTFVAKSGTGDKGFIFNYRAVQNGTSVVI